MTTLDIAGLCSLLRAVESSGHGGVTTNWHRNPDGPQAADTLERQAAEIERLRSKVEGLESDLQDAVQIAYLRGATVWAQLNYPDIIGWLSRSSEARAALTGEDMTPPDIAGLCERLQMIVSELQGLPHVVETCREGKDTIERQAAEIKRLRDKVEGLESDLRCAVQVAYNRGATEWARLNYPDMIEWLESCAEARAALTGEDTATLSLSGKTQTDDRTRGRDDGSLRARALRPHRGPTD
jgi:hypothetical protein